VRGAVAASTAEADLPRYQVARRQRIIDAAGTLLEERDYEQIQVRDVADAAHFAVGTVYRYFSSKEHLYAAVLHSWGSRFGEVSRGPEGADPLARLETRMRKVLESFEAAPTRTRPPCSSSSASRSRGWSGRTSPSSIRKGRRITLS